MPNTIATMSTTYVPISTGRPAAYRNPSTIPARLGRTALLGRGHRAHEPEQAPSDTAYVAMSKPYVAGRPATAIRIPANAGPTSIPTFMRKLESAASAASSSRSTSRGAIASSAGRWMLSSPRHGCGDDEQHPGSRLAHERVDEQRRGAHHQPRLAQEDDTPPVVRIRERTAEEGGGEDRNQLGGREKPHRQRRARELVHLERDGHEGDHRAEERDRLAGEEQPEVAVTAQRPDVDREQPEPRGARLGDGRRGADPGGFLRVPVVLGHGPTGYGSVPPDQAGRTGPAPTVHGA